MGAGEATIGVRLSIRQQLNSMSADRTPGADVPAESDVALPLHVRLLTLRMQTCNLPADGPPNSLLLRPELNAHRVGVNGES
jgi:hypothetical protein